jgi:hypothetical protein
LQRVKGLEMELFCFILKISKVISMVLLRSGQEEGQRWKKTMPWGKKILE